MKTSPQHINTSIRLVLFGLLFGAMPLSAKQWQVQPHHDLQEILNQAQANDRIIIEAGEYHGNFEITKPLSLRCKEQASLNGQRRLDTIKITSSNVTVEGCRILNWGNDLTRMDAGIVVKRQADNVLIKNNYFHGSSFAVFLDASPNTKVHNNHIEGIETIRSQDRGNGIHLYATKGADIAFNTVWHTRDGIYIDTSNDNIIRNNEFHHLRYGVHYMYSYRNKVINNYTHHTRTGYALMQSKFLTVTGNRSENDQNYGILMNYITNSVIKNNHVINVRQGTNPAGGQSIAGAEGKALFMYNSLYNEIRNNLFKTSGLGIHLTAGSEDNDIYLNSFIGNEQQVKYVANRIQEWSKDHQGNFWSDYMGWDRNQDGKGDTPYEPNDSVDKLLWKYPSARILMNSPAVETLRWIQREFPVLKSPGVKDSYPLMQPNSSANNPA